MIIYNYEFDKDITYKNKTNRSFSFYNPKDQYEFLCYITDKGYSYTFNRTNKGE